MKTKEATHSKKTAKKDCACFLERALPRKIFRHGGSYAVDLPMVFVKRNGNPEVFIEEVGNGLFIHPSSQWDIMENDPLFSKFIQAIYHDAISNPSKLHDMKEVWDDKTVSMLKDVAPYNE
jgi:virulence-associated protein VagC